MATNSNGSNHFTDHVRIRLPKAEDEDVSNILQNAAQNIEALSTSHVIGVVLCEHDNPTDPGQGALIFVTNKHDRKYYTELRDYFQFLIDSGKGGHGTA